jgi:hypothetical protein
VIDAEVNNWLRASDSEAIALLRGDFSSERQPNRITPGLCFGQDELLGFRQTSPRHCERSEAIKGRRKKTGLLRRKNS